MCCPGREGLGGGCRKSFLVAGSPTIPAPVVSLIVQGIILVVLANLHSQLDFFFLNTIIEMNSSQVLTCLLRLEGITRWAAPGCLGSSTRKRLSHIFFPSSCLAFSSYITAMLHGVTVGKRVQGRGLHEWISTFFSSLSAVFVNTCEIFLVPSIFWCFL